MTAVKRPTVVNIRNPLAIERIVEEVQSGRARNYSEAAENLILKETGKRRDETQADADSPASLPAS